ncbi:HAMP domain-containing sensor histidine kinase [Methanocalculus natronophilus]|uniref:sensor histidine kinase n=1 Tax=Methanocalculus natronophilus TaxID=1262400 RepID=UPI0031B5DC90
MTIAGCIRERLLRAWFYINQTNPSGGEGQVPDSLQQKSCLKTYAPLIAIILSTAFGFSVAIYSISIGYYIIFQNLFYIPIIIACISYLTRGFIFSTLLAFLYFILVASFTLEPVILQGALIRVVLFIVIAGVVTHLALLKTRAEEALLLSNQQLHLLSSITRHDLLNKLMPLRGYLDLLSESRMDPTQQRYLREADLLTRSMQRHIDFTREYEKLGKNKPTWQSVTGIIKEIVETTLPVTFICDVACDDIKIYADPLLPRVFEKLIENSNTHAEGASEIIIRCMIDESALEIILEDDGCGIPDEHKEAIFSRGVGRNTGYGLYLSRNILGITGISITEDSESGKGARFHIKIPKTRFRIETSYEETDYKNPEYNTTE